MAFFLLCYGFQPLNRMSSTIQVHRMRINIKASGIRLTCKAFAIQALHVVTCFILIIFLTVRILSFLFKFIVPISVLKVLFSRSRIYNIVIKVFYSISLIFSANNGDFRAL